MGDHLSFRRRFYLDGWDRSLMRGRGMLIEDCYIPSAGLCAYRNKVVHECSVRLFEVM